MHDVMDKSTDTNFDYEAFIKAKECIPANKGFEVNDDEINQILKPFQRACVRWALAGGCRGLFESFGLGKSVQQLEIVRLVLKYLGTGRGIIAAPLGVRQEFMRDAEMLGIKIKFVRTTAEVLAASDDIFITNYESIREGKIDLALFDVISLDEASCLRSFGSKTFSEFLFGDVQKVKYRFVATATPSPNEYQELLAYAHFLGIMDIGQARTRFFKRNSEKADNLTLHRHKEREFWLWVASWGLFLQKPSDICNCICQNEKTLPDSGSENLLLGNGSRTADRPVDIGSVNAIAETQSPAHLHTSPTDKTEAVVVSDPNMEANTPELMESGKRCSNGVETQTTKIGKTTEVEASPSANDGTNSQTSSLTWESHQKDTSSTEKTTTATTSPITAIGQPQKKTPLTDELEAKKQNLVKRKCCEKCNCDDGYELPDLEVVFHELPVDHSTALPEKSGQGRLVREARGGVSEASKEKRETLVERVAKMREIVALSHPNDHFLIWHDLEAERRAIENALPEVVSVYGSQKLEVREKSIIDFSDGQIQYLAGKPQMLGSGCNFQRHCHRAIYVGIGYKFNDFIQSIYRLLRYLQTHKVRIDIIYAESERGVLDILLEKWERDKEQRAVMTEIIKKYGLVQDAMRSELSRSTGVDRAEITGELFECINNDSVIECRGREENSVDLIITSVPFANQYEYTPSYNDFGHTDDNEHFFAQMDFLTPELLRMLKPGRIAAIHCKDRVVDGKMSGLGFQTIYRFSDKLADHYEKHGFYFIGKATVVTDVVRENNQTYRLGYSEQLKDATKHGVGMPEYVLYFRKPPTDTANSYGDFPVVKNAEDYGLGRWQIDAHGFMRSSGERLLMPEEIKSLPWKTIYGLFKQFSLNEVYDYEKHVELCTALRDAGRLPIDFMLLPPQSWHEDVWTDITRMRTLNSSQAQKGKQMHLCPLQFDIVDRLIIQKSMPGEVVFDPFGGLMTVPVRAVRLGRRGIGVELNHNYFLDGAAYCKAAEMKALSPTLFDLAEIESEVAEEMAEEVSA